MIMNSFMNSRIEPSSLSPPKSEVRNKIGAGGTIPKKSRALVSDKQTSKGAEPRYDIKIKIMMMVVIVTVNDMPMVVVVRMMTMISTLQRTRKKRKKKENPDS